MQPNPLLKKLGLSDDDRAAVIHADDIGMSQATLPAIAELFEFGLVSSAAIMVPCPWFQGAAQYAAAHPDASQLSGLAEIRLSGRGSHHPIHPGA